MISKAQKRTWNQKGLDALTNVVERRRHQRISTSISGHIHLGVSRFEITVVDLSRSGALMRWDNKLNIPLQVGDSLEVSFIWPLQGSNCALHLEANVARLDTDAIAVQFAHLVDEPGPNH